MATGVTVMTVSTVAVAEVNAERRITLLRRGYRYDETKAESLELSLS